MLKKVRAYLKQAHATALIVPHDDSFFNEELLPCDERLACLTGFTGSAGMAVVTQTKAVLFVDGRYVEQAKQQTKFSVLHVPKQTTIQSWFEDNIHQNDVFLYDPWLQSVAQIDRWKKIFEQKKAVLMLLDENVIDKFWTDKPLKPKVREYDYPLQYAGQTTDEKMKQVHTLLQQKQLDAFFVCNPNTVSWLLNKRSDAVEFNPVVLKRVLVSHKANPLDMTQKTLSMLMGKTVGIDPYETSYQIAKKLEDAGAIIKKMQNPLLMLQAQKNDVEAQGMAKAGMADSIAVCRYFAYLAKHFKRETEVSAVSYLNAVRAQNPLYCFNSFADISAADENAALPHYQACAQNAKKLEKAKIYLLDTGGQYQCGTTDMTRTISLNSVTKEMKKRYTQVLKGHIALASAVFPQGTTAGQLDVLARQFLWQDGVDFNHGTGHGIGCFLSVHEAPPAISPNNPDALVENMILSNEPGFYLSGKFGIRIENMMKVVKSAKQKGFLKFEMLTFVPFCDELIEKSMLTNDEKSWISSYYAQIKAQIYPQVTKEEREWLNKQMKKWLI